MERGITEKVYQYLTKNKGVEVSGDDIAADLGITKLQAQGAISHLSRKLGAVIDKPLQGWYIYRGQSKNGSTPIVPVKTKAVVQALLDDGRVLLTIEGKLYVADELTIE